MTNETSDDTVTLTQYQWGYMEALHRASGALDAVFQATAVYGERNEVLEKASEEVYRLTDGPFPEPPKEKDADNAPRGEGDAMKAVNEILHKYWDAKKENGEDDRGYIIAVRFASGANTSRPMLTWSDDLNAQYELMYRSVWREIRDACFEADSGESQNVPLFKEATDFYIHRLIDAEEESRHLYGPYPDLSLGRAFEEACRDAEAVIRGSVDACEERMGDSPEGTGYARYTAKALISAIRTMPRPPVYI